MGKRVSSVIIIVVAIVIIINVTSDYMTPPHAKHCSLHVLTHLLLSTYKVGVIISSILQMGKLRHRGSRTSKVLKLGTF